MLLVMKQPVAVTINNPRCLRAYKAGVLREEECNCSNDRYFDKDVEQSALIVGYSLDTRIMGCRGHWLVKNSWGENWGENGYIRLCISSVPDGNDFGMCNVLATPQIPFVGIFDI